ncbi:unnamed protein product, partial [Symbiodinium microadriaticum]
RAILDRLTTALVWEQLTLQELRRECQARDVVFTGLRSRSEGEQRQGGSANVIAPLAVRRLSSQATPGAVTVMDLDNGDELGCEDDESTVPGSPIEIEGGSIKDQVGLRGDRDPDEDLQIVIGGSGPAVGGLKAFYRDKYDPVDIQHMHDPLALYKAQVGSFMPAPALVTKEELEQVLLQTKSRKSCGQDGAPYELWCAVLQSEAADHLVDFVNRILLEDVDFPDEWLNPQIVLLPKVKEPKHPKDFRPIVLAATLSKLVTKVFLVRLRDRFPPMPTGQLSAQKGAQSLDGEELRWRRNLVATDHGTQSTLKPFWATGDMLHGFRKTGDRFWLLPQTHPPIDPPYPSSFKHVQDTEEVDEVSCFTFACDGSRKGTLLGAGVAVLPPYGEIPKDAILCGFPVRGAPATNIRAELVGATKALEMCLQLMTKVPEGRIVLLTDSAYVLQVLEGGSHFFVRTADYNRAFVPEQGAQIPDLLGMW